MFEPISASAKSSAWTNFLQLREPAGQAAAKLLTYLSDNGMRWQVENVTLDKFQGKNPAPLINNCKREIAASMGNGFRAESIPFFRNTRNKLQYYYLRPQRGDTGIPPATDVDPSVIIRLCLMAALLDDVRFGSRQLHAESIGPQIYVGVRSFRTKKDVLGVEAFRLDLEFRHDQIQTILVAQAMKVESGAMVSGMVPESYDGIDGFPLSLVPADQVRRWDGRKTKLQDITFRAKEIHASRLYLLNRLTERFGEILAKAGVAYSRDTFEPTHVVSKPHLKLESIAHVPTVLTIINNTQGLLSTEAQAAIVQALSRDGVTFEAIEFLHDGAPTPDSSWVATLDPSNAWLVLNREGDDEIDTSIRIEGTLFNRPWDAYHALANDAAGLGDVDAYTWAKFSRLYRGDRAKYPVMQGIDLNVSGQQPQVGQEAEGLRRCAVELAVKHRFSAGRIPLSAKTPEGNYTLLYADRVFLLESGEWRKPLDYLACTRISVSNDELRIVDHVFYPELSLDLIDELRDQFPCLGRKIQGDSLYLIDDASGRYLRRYSGAIVPKIVLNSRYTGIDEALSMMEANGGLTDKGYFSRSSDWSLLPFYAPPSEKVAEDIRWRDTSFIEDRGSFIRYFVPSQLSPKASSGFSNMHDLMVYKPGSHVNTGFVQYDVVKGGLLEEPLVRLYLSTLTNGVMRLNENSKASLLEKLARLAGMDT